MRSPSLEQPGASRQPVATPEDRICPACLGGPLLPFLDLGEMPVQIGTQWPSRAAALDCLRGRIQLAFCERCAFVTNLGFASASIDYAHPYDNDLSFSSVYQEYERRLVERLIGDYGLRGKQVIEIGCGHGKFLNRLCAAGDLSGVGFDPSHQGGQQVHDRVEFVADYYPDARGPREADLIVCRQVFEHVPEPLAFLRRLRETLREPGRPVVYFEVPGFDHVLSELALWTIIYEHCSYFTRDSLEAVFARAGFEVIRSSECFDGQFLSLEAVPVAEPSAVKPAVNDRLVMSRRIEAFRVRLDEKLALWSERMTRWAADGKQVAVWGAGARAVCFLNLVRPADPVVCVVDINPNKLGKFVPGSGQEIVGPAFLSVCRPDVIIIMNDIYQDEIRRTVEALGLSPQFSCA